MGSKTSRLVGSFGHALLALAWFGCGTQPEEGTETSETREALVEWAKAHFSQVVRVNPGPTTVRNVCELTVLLDEYKPMTIEATGSGGGSVTAGWTGSAISVTGLEVQGCVDYPCEVLIDWRGTGANGVAMGCQIAVDDATTRVVGSSSGTALTVVGTASAPILFNQDMRLSASGSAISGSAVLRHGSVLADARVNGFEVSVDGFGVGTLPDQTEIGDVVWPTKDLSIDFGAVVRGEDDLATRLKHIAPLKEHLDPGQALRYRGTFLEDADSALFDVNVQNAPVGLGMTLTTPPSLWTCHPTWFGSGGACNCNCGVFDPDCASGTEDCSTCPGGDLSDPAYANLAPPLGAPLDGVGTPLDPPAPAGWTWYEIPGSQCRDGSPAGFFVHIGTANQLLWYLEGGGACISPGFCNSFNPANVNQVISGNGETVLGSAFGVTAARQQPGVFELGVMNGIFDFSNAANPFKDWSMIYTPYCTGDAHFGSQPNGTVPGLAAPQQFVGHLNMREFAARIVPTFPNVTRVILTGASAGGFGAALNFSMVQDAFGCTPVEVIDDSGPPFIDQYMPACMQQKWRTLWGMNASLPPDCAACFQAGGGGILNLADFLMAKHPQAKLALVSSMQDEVIRLFFSPGLKNCQKFDTADPVAITVGQIIDPSIYMSAADYAAGLNDLRSRFLGTGRFATYYLGGLNINLHQHLFRARFYDPAAGTKSIAAFVTDFLGGAVEQIGPSP